MCLSIESVACNPWFTYVMMSPIWSNVQPPAHLYIVDVHTRPVLWVPMGMRLILCQPIIKEPQHFAQSSMVTNGSPVASSHQWLLIPIYHQWLTIINGSSTPIQILSPKILKNLPPSLSNPKILNFCRVHQWSLEVNCWATWHHGLRSRLWGPKEGDAERS